LKEPSPAAIAHSKLLSAKIIEKINLHGGKISFSDFMQQALYAPCLGYYSAGATKFGASGDFITAPELGSLFAKCVAKQCAEILQTLNSYTILEIGAGSGQLACDLFLALGQLNINLDNYLILELSADLKQRQQQKIKELCPQFYDRVQWLDQLPQQAINGIILANEVIDAMPVTRFCFTQNKLQEYYVIEKSSHFEYSLEPPNDELERAFSAANIGLYLEPNKSDYNSEINLWLQPWLKSLSTCLNSGAILLFDYGFPRSEYYHPQRDNGTLMCHYQHLAHSDPFFYPGLQDITAHVDFTAVAEAADLCALNVSGYTNLAGFLINCGINEFPPSSSKQAQELNSLSSPAEMGELFKAMILTRMNSENFLGFSQFDKLHTL
jgi:SAM-dependent MidA family methyltransferase